MHYIHMSKHKAHTHILLFVFAFFTFGSLILAWFYNSIGSFFFSILSSKIMFSWVLFYTLKFVFSRLPDVSLSILTL